MGDAAQEAPSPTAAAFRRAIESKAVSDAVALLADDVRFESPIVHRLYQGRDAVAPVLFAVSTVFENFRYTAEFSSADGHVMRFSARVDDRDLDGVDILQVDADGRISTLTVMVRPYSAATALKARMAALLSGGGSAVQERPL